MSTIFEKASVWNPYDVVRIERRTPRRYDRHGRLMALDEEAGSVEESSGGEEKREHPVLA
jgi:hypothetical protein